jgi:hypothetical protein
MGIRATSRPEFELEIVEYRYQKRMFLWLMLGRKESWEKVRRTRYVDSPKVDHYALTIVSERV